MSCVPEDYVGCWQIMGCGREPGGRNAERDGVCVAARHPGSACWMLAGKPDHPDRTQVCHRIRDGRLTCETCRVYRQVHDALHHVEIRLAPRIAATAPGASPSGDHGDHFGRSWLDAIGW